MNNPQEIISILSDIAVLVASVIAGYGVIQWKVQARWQRKFEIARETYIAFYRVRDAIQYMRHPASTSDEGKSRRTSESKEKSEPSIQDRAYIPFERYQSRIEEFQRLDAIKYSFAATFGKQHLELFFQVNRIKSRVFASAHMLGRIYWPRQGNYFESDEARKRHMEQMEKYEAIFWDMGDEDAINQELEELIAQLEQVCRKYLR